MEKIIEIKNKAEFDDLLKSNKPILVDFHGTWCNPCKMITPIINQIADEYNDLIVCKIDVDENVEITTEYKIRSIPTLMVFNEKGKLVKQKSGAMPKTQIVELFSDLLL